MAKVTTRLTRAGAEGRGMFLLGTMKMWRCGAERPTTQNPMTTIPLPDVAPEKVRTLLPRLMDSHAQVSSRPEGGAAKASLPLLERMIRHYKTTLLPHSVSERLDALNAELARLLDHDALPEPTDGPIAVVNAMIAENLVELYLGPSSSSSSSSSSAAAAAPAPVAQTPKPSDVETVGDETEEEEVEPLVKKPRMTSVQWWWANIEPHPLARAVGVASKAVKQTPLLSSVSIKPSAVHVEGFNATAHLAWLEHLVETASASRRVRLRAMVDFFKYAQPHIKVRWQPVLALRTKKNTKPAHCLFCGQLITPQEYSVSVCEKEAVEKAAEKGCRVVHQYHAACASFIHACNSHTCFCKLHDVTIKTKCLTID
jgi:hypothetical protein